MDKACERDDCPGEENWEAGYGLAGGGIGPYMYCNVCGEIRNKLNELESENEEQKMENEDMKIAQVAHEANRAYCIRLGDMSQPRWEDAPEWQRQSAIKGVEFVKGNPDATPEDSHNSWLKQKIADGWKYGPVKDAKRKEHPCFRGYDELPVEQRRKDALFNAVVKALI